MKALNNIVITLIALAMVVALSAGAYYGIKFVIDLFKGLDTLIANIIYATLFTIIFGALTISLIVRRTQERSKRNYIFIQKVETYKRVIKSY